LDYFIQDPNLKLDVVNQKTGYAFRDFETPQQLEMMKKIHELWFQQTKKNVNEKADLTDAVPRP